MQMNGSRGSAPALGECLSEGWQRFQPQLGMLVLVTLVYGVITSVAWAL